MYIQFLMHKEIQEWEQNSSLSFSVTVACGITSGFHSTQCTLIGRSVEHEKKDAQFYGMMILEGLIARFAAAAKWDFTTAVLLQELLQQLAKLQKPQA